jgi:protein-tyrosine phosphatase
MIDTHIHIIPCVDDGAKDMDQALEMCRICVDEGITRIVASPHDLNGVFSNNRESILSRITELNEILRSEHIPLEVLPGADLAMVPELPEKIDSNSIMSINDANKYILLEPPLYFIPNALLKQVFEIRRRGITPIITHPERNETIMNHKEILHDAIISGALVQITAGSITGRFGPAIKKQSIHLLEHKMAHIIASDAHNTVSRKPGLLKALKIASSIVGETEADNMVNKTPLAVVSGNEIEVEDPVLNKEKQGWFSKFFSRKTDG